MRVIGLTGGIATGKTAVAGLLAAKGAAVIDTDVLAREIVEPGQPAYDAIVAHFGPGILCPDGAIDRAGLGAIIFGDPAAREALDAMTHPAIRELMLERLADLHAACFPPPAAVLAIPLLYENGLEGLVDEVWVVSVALETQRRRLMQRNGLEAFEASQRIEAQMPLALKVARATRVIPNDGTLAALSRAVDEAWQAAGLSAPPNDNLINS